MVGGNKILVRAEKFGISKTWLWDAKRPLRIRRPMKLELHRAGNDLILRDESGSEHRVGTWGDSLEIDPGHGAELHVSPVTSLSRPKVAPVLSPKAGSESARFGFSFLASALASALVWLSFGMPDSGTTTRQVTPLKEMKVQSLPSGLNLPAPVPLEFKRLPVLPSGVGSASGQKIGSSTGQASKGSSPSANVGVAPSGIVPNSGPATVGTGKAGRVGPSAGVAQGNQARVKADLIREAFGDLTGSGSAAADGGVGSGSGAGTDTSGKAGTRRTRFGFGKAGTPNNADGEEAGGGLAKAMGSSSQVVQQITQSFGSSAEGAGTPLGKVSALGAGESGSGWATANIEGLGYNPILLDTENLSVGEGLTHQEVHGVIQRHVSEVRRCHELSSRKGSTFQGKVLVQFRIQPNGISRNPALAGAESMDTELKDCLLRRVSTWKFSSPRGRREVDVSYPFVFMTLDGAP